MIIRKETKYDLETISEIARSAFEGRPYSVKAEPYIIMALRAARALTLSLVAEVHDRVVGHIAFSPVTLSEGSESWYGLGPLSVLPDMQRKGVGKALVSEGVALLKSEGARGCILVGDPGYYGRFGFRVTWELAVLGVPQEYVLVLPFAVGTPRGEAKFHQAFAATE